jgi:hypothetical protein
VMFQVRLRISPKSMVPSLVFGWEYYSHSMVAGGLLLMS